MNPHISADEDILGDFCDGSLFQAHPLFSLDVYALQIIAYYDDLEIVNPLGSFVKRHKLGCLFFFLANVRPQYRSTFKTIHLVAVAKTQDINVYGIDAFLTPFIEDLKELYCDGIVGLFNGIDAFLTKSFCVTLPLQRVHWSMFHSSSWPYVTAFITHAAACSRTGQAVNTTRLSVQLYHLHCSVDLQQFLSTAAALQWQMTWELSDASAHGLMWYLW